jgi:hypothetical protein
VRCKTCQYSLKNLIEHRCPECGTPFDPNDPAALAGQPFPWGTFLFRTASGYLILLLLLLTYLHADRWPPWKSSEFPIFAISILFPVAIGNFLTLKCSWFGWLMALLLAGFALLLFMPAVAR